VKPYWQSDDGAIVVYHARYEDVLASGVVPVREVALVHDDPPYGVGESTNRRAKGRGRQSSAGSRAIAVANDFPPVTGDDEPFDPAPILALDRPTVLWGANHYSERVPPSPSWIYWDKRRDVLPDDNADGELAWSNLGGPLRRFVYLWKGACQDGEKGGKRLGPTQKPIALSSYVFERAKLKRGDLVFVPHGGSGPDLPACRAMGLRLIWCDVERWCCDTAIARLGGITAERAAEPAGPLFAGVRNGL
jgi:site-specific DNA-methyltransferase (adenine-specific)/modification methylase